MQVLATPLVGLFAIQPRVFEDARGFFFESYNRRTFAEHDIDLDWVQDNHARSVRGTIRGMHFQRGDGQPKLVRCIKGRVWDVAVDIRPESPTFGQWHALELSEDNKTMLFIPSGMAHGYAVLSESADCHYKCATLYDPALEDGFRWDDPDVAIDWPFAEPILSQRDQASQSFAALRERLMQEPAR